MPYTQFTNLDFDQIKAEIKSYLRANSNFTDFDFEGSNFSVLIDTLAYNTYINAFNANLVVNESFLDGATVRENVVSLARNIGYTPRSKSAAKAHITFSVPTASTSKTMTLVRGLVAVGPYDNTTYRFSIPENITTTIKNGVATFGTADNPIEVYQGTALSRSFLVDTSIDQRYIIDNPNVDASTIRVFVGNPGATNTGREYKQIDNILNIDKASEIFLLQEVGDEKYELLFGDGYFGRKLENGSEIYVDYIVTDGEDGNGPSDFDFQGNLVDEKGIRITPSANFSINTVQGAINGGEIESVSSIKYFAPRLYSAQYRAVTSRDYEAIISSIYTNTESVAVVGGEELTPPKFGTVQISIKPKNGSYISDFDKQNILNELKKYSIAGINQQIIDLKVLYVELDSTVYYDNSRISNASDLKSRITSALNIYSKDVDMNRFGGRFKYSKALQLIDRVDNAITSNITKVKIRRDMKALLNQFAQYEVCFGNRFHINPAGYNIKSSGFTVSGSTDTVFFTDVPNKDANGNLDGSGKGVLSAIRKTDTDQLQVVLRGVGTVDYTKGEILVNTINITSTLADNNIIEIQAFPESNDVVGLKDLYLTLDVSNTQINTIKDVIASGEDISGVSFARDYYTSSYSNGTLERK